MTPALWIDATAGAAGDMLLGALLDAGADRAAVDRALAALAAAAGETITLEVASVRRHGLRAAHAVVGTSASVVRRGLAEVLAVLDAAELPLPARQFSGAVFERLAAAEALVHGVPADQVHFHEVGALDALADVVGCATALDSLGLLGPAASVTVSPVGLGTGTVRASHGRLPVPVPAVVLLLADAGAPASSGDGDGELCTPTGAALLVTLATAWGPLPAMTVRSAGTGAGTRDPADHANIVRAVLGESTGSPPSWRTQTLRLVESTVDDLDPRLWPEALDALRAAGALDAWLTAATMRAGRPAQVVTALASEDVTDSVVRALFYATTTLGVRVTEVRRYSLPRDSVLVDVAGQPVSVKRGFVDGEPVTVQPEFADARAAAVAAGLPVGEVIDTARQRAREAPHGSATPR